MTKTQKLLQQINARVRFIEDGSLGTIIEVGYNAVKVQWDDGQLGIIADWDYDTIEVVKP